MRGLESKKVPKPRMLIDVWSFPGRPERWTLVTPGNLPVIILDRLAWGAIINSLEPTWETEPIKNFFFWVPYPTTTTSSNAFASSCNLIVISERPCKATSWVWYPTNETTKVDFKSCTFKLNCPSILVIVPLDKFPFTLTVAPTSGSLFESYTVPFTFVFFWAWAFKKESEQMNKAINLILHVICFSILNINVNKTR